ncbi:MAG: GNAT family N-acetyltransferase [Campylobacteraceae bacterium]|nr:GNAT family N-acetyltransferase [Campylobacteraceae bacterium]
MFEILSAKVKDANKICSLLRRSISEVCASDYGYNEQVLEEWLANKTIKNVRYWINHTHRSSFICMNENNEIVGFCLLDISGEILLNYVLPEYLYKGVGKLLLEAMEQDLLNHKIFNVRVISSITAKSFYERNGYIKNGKASLVGEIEGDFPLIKKL